MASTDFERILVKDDRVGCVTDQIKYGVLKGGQNITSQTFNAISKSTSAHVFNIAVPSLETIISREVLWNCEFTLRLECYGNSNDGGTAPLAGGASRAGRGTAYANHFAVNHGVTDALGPFQLH